MFPYTKPKREIDAGQLRNLAADYGTRRNVAKVLKMHYSQFCRKLSESQILKEAFDSGVREFEKRKSK